MTEIESPRSKVFPPFISLGIHEKISGEDVRIKDLLKPDKNIRKKPKRVVILRYMSLEIPIPLHPLTITWSPNYLHFEIKDDIVVQKLWVWNTCYHTIYIHCCDHWNDTAFFGAKWHCYPKTRFHLAPGLKGELFIRVVPKEQSPICCASAKFQLAAAHKRDVVTGFFSVPVMVKYLNFVEETGEEG